VELRHLRYYVAVAEMENVSRAALKLHVSQPALSRQIRDLEEEIGFNLLERTAKSVKLTDAGELFLEEARAVLERADEAVRKARAVAKAGETELHVGYAPTPTARLLPKVLRGCQSAMPNVHIRLHDLSNGESIARLKDGRLQLAFIIRPRKAGTLRDLRFEGLLRAEARLAISPLHPLARRRSVSLEEAAGQPFLAYTREEYPEYHEFLNLVFASSKAKPRIVEEHEDASSLIPAIEAGTGVALVGDFLSDVAGKRLKLLRLVPEPEPVEFGIAARKGRLSPAAEKFWECAREATRP
jgi:DNA-binding transcriptional LysR family regulator